MTSLEVGTSQEPRDVSVGVQPRGEIEQLDRIVIRFAGDSGDGMQLTGDRFTSASALFGNDLSTLPEYPAEIRAPAGTVHGVSSFQVHISDHDITTPGDAPSVLVAMNPAALRADLHTLTIGGTLIVNIDTFDERNLAKAHYTANPLEDGSLSNYRLIDRADDLADQRRHRAVGGQAPRCRPLEELLRAGSGQLHVLTSRRVDARVDRRAVRQGAHGAGVQPRGVLGRDELRRDDRGVRPSLRGPPGADAARRVHQHHRQRRAVVGPGRGQSVGQAAVDARLVPHHAGVRHPARAVEAQALRRPHGAGRGRDRRRGHRHRGRVRRASRHHHHIGSGRRAEEREHQPGHFDGAAVHPDRHPARRPVDRVCPPRPRPPT